MVFFSVLSSSPGFLSRPVSLINKLKNTFQPYKVCYRKAYVTANGFKRKSDKTHLLKTILLHREKDQKKNFSAFLCKRPFDHRKEFLKNSQFHFKGFHFKSTSSGSFNKVLWKSRNKKSFRGVFKTQLKIYDGAFRANS